MTNFNASSSKEISSNDLSVKNLFENVMLIDS